MDRLDAMRIFVTTLEEGSLAGAGRRLGRSPAAVTRAIVALEAHVGVRLLHRTTRVMRLTEAGERYASVCNAVLSTLETADLMAIGDRAAPRGTLTITAPVMFGTRILRPIVSGFLAAQPEVSVRYLLLDRPVNLIEEGIDVALRIAHLPDSALIAIRLGTVRRVVCAAPRYLARVSPVANPDDLATRDCIAVSTLGQGEIWTFPAASGGAPSRAVRIKPRLTLNAVEPAVNAAIDGEGIIRVLSYQTEQAVRDGHLVILLKDHEPPPLPVHLIVPDGRLAVAKVRAFVDFVTPKLKAQFAASAGSSA